MTIKKKVLLLILVILSALIGWYLIQNYLNQQKALNFVVSESKNIEIEGKEVYRKLGKECKDFKVGKGHQWICSYKLDVFYEGKGDHVKEYFYLQNGIEKAGYLYSEFYAGDIKEHLNTPLTDINDYMPGRIGKSGLYDENRTILLTPIFAGDNINNYSIHGIYLTPEAPYNATKNYKYIYGYTFRKFYSVIDYLEILFYSTFIAIIVTPIILLLLGILLLFKKHLIVGTILTFIGVITTFSFSGKILYHMFEPLTRKENNSFKANNITFKVFQPNYIPTQLDLSTSNIYSITEPCLFLEYSTKGQSAGFNLIQVNEKSSIVKDFMCTRKTDYPYKLEGTIYAKTNKGEDIFIESGDEGTLYFLTKDGTRIFLRRYGLPKEDVLNVINSLEERSITDFKIVDRYGKFR